MSDHLYYDFIKYVNSIVTSNDLHHFKSNPNVTYMLEHVSESVGHLYLNYIKALSIFTDHQIISYCQLNDKYGGGQKYNYGWITTSPSNFRYLLHAHLIFSHMKKKGMDEVKVAEVGCGYGGLCLALITLSPIYNITITEYHLIDLPDINSLQKRYLSNFELGTTLSFHSAYTYGSAITDTNLFLVSNYCFSEIDDAHQKQYIAQLFPKVSHGFMTWNHIVLYDFGFNFQSEAEYPLTSNNSNPLLNNKYVYF